MQIQLNRLIGIVLLVLGIVLLVLGLRAIDSFSSQFSKFFTGSPTDRAVWLTISGIVGILAGATMMMLPNRASSR